MAASSLLQRVLTAAFLIPIVVVAILYLPTIWLALLLAAIALLGGWEWGALAGISKTGAKTTYVALLAVCFLAAYQMKASPEMLKWFFSLGILWWGLVTFNLIRCKKIELAEPGVDLPRAVVGLFVLAQLWMALILLHDSGNKGPFLVLFLMVLIWVADSGAYFAGRRWGRRKLAPVVSPGKSWEGVYGALVGAILCGILLFWYLGSGEATLWLIPVCVITVLMSVVGDLFESLLKRRVAMKDSGAILPGHGGVLDRIDSLTAAAPVFLVGLSFTTGL